MITENQGTAKLNADAKQLETLCFLHPLTEDEQASVKRAWVSRKVACTHSVYMSRWTIVLCLGGRCRILGILKGNMERAEKALRFADMAKLYFFKYKVRGAVEPKPGQLNFTVQRAKQDLANEPHMLSLLQQQERTLLDSGIIKVPVPGAPSESRKRLKIAEALPAMIARLTNMEARIGAHVAELTGKLEAVSTGIKRIDHVDRRLDAICKQFDDMAKRLTDLEATNLSAKADQSAQLEIIASAMQQILLRLNNVGGGGVPTVWDAQANRYVPGLHPANDPNFVTCDSSQKQVSTSPGNVVSSDKLKL